MSYESKTNWQRGEILEDGDLNRIEQGISDVYTRLDQIKSNDLTLEAGTKTITVPRDIPFNVLSLKGMMLLNLLGRSGKFESLAGWSISGGTGLLTTTNAQYGSNALLFTLSGTSGSISRQVPVTSGSRYLAAVEVRLDTATSANIVVPSVPQATPVTAKGSYQLMYVLFTATGSSVNLSVSITGISSQTAYVDGFRLYELSATDYATAEKFNRTGIAARYPYTEGLAGVRNPYAIRWTDSSKTEVASMLGIQAEFFADTVSGANADTLSQGVDGQYYRKANYRKIQLSGALAWRFGDTTGVGFKQVAVNGLVSGAVAGSGIAIKYDGKILPQGTTGSIADVQAVSSTGDFFISISAADSGWGDNFTPSMAEIQAYIYGWKMYDSSTNATDGLGVYNGSNPANKRWTPLASFDGSSYSGNVSTVPTSRPENSISGAYRASREVTSYELLCRHTSPIIESVVSEGQLSLVEGANLVEVGTGLVLREAVKPAPDSTASAYYINGRTTYPSSGLTEDAIRSFFVYRNGRFDAWGQDNQGSGSGSRQAGILAIGYDRNASYSVTYFSRANYPTAPFTGNYPDSERAALAELVRGLQQTTRRVSVVENKKIEKDAITSLIVPTWLSGWRAFGDGFQSGYRKIAGTDWVVFNFMLAGGSSNGSMPMMQFPRGFRPSKVTFFTGVSRNSDGSALSVNGVGVQPNGDLTVGIGTLYTSAFVVSGVFLAEQ